MKQLFVTLSLVAASFFSNATDRVVSGDIHSSFESQFTQAADTRWSQVDHLYKADFTMNGRAMSAFYEASGELVAVTKPVSSLELPEALAAGLKKELQDGWISELFVMSTKEGDIYFANIESAQGSTVLRAESHKKWTVFEKKTK